MKQDTDHRIAGFLSSQQMENSEIQKRIINLGKALVEEIGLDPGVDTLARWMAHYIAEQMEIAEELYQLLDRLKEDERAIVIATEIEGKTYRHLSEKWGVPVNTLISKKSRSLEKIRKHALFLKE